jgi:hypothetical protein
MQLPQPKDAMQTRCGPCDAVGQWRGGGCSSTSQCRTVLAGRTPTPEAATAAVPTPTTERAGPPSAASAQRRQRVEAGLRDLDRWLVDRVRNGVGTGDLDKQATWDHLATRLVDAQCGALANRVKRLATRAHDGTATPQAITAELAMLHLIARGGQDLSALEQRDEPLAASLRTAIGFAMSSAQVMASAPITDHWLAMGASLAAEERVTIRRTWLWGQRSQTWAVIIDAAAYGMGFTELWPIGTAVHGDLHRVHAKVALRALVGVRHSGPEWAAMNESFPPQSASGSALGSTALGSTALGSTALSDPPEPGSTPWSTIDGAMARAGMMIADEPWLERVPFAAIGHPARMHGRWVLSDATGSLPSRQTGRVVRAQPAGCDV